MHLYLISTSNPSPRECTYIYLCSREPLIVLVHVRSQPFFAGFALPACSTLFDLIGLWWELDKGLSHWQQISNLVWIFDNTLLATNVVAVRTFTAPLFWDLCGALKRFRNEVDWIPSWVSWHWGYLFVHKMLSARTLASILKVVRKRNAKVFFE